MIGFLARVGSMWKFAAGFWNRSPLAIRIGVIALAIFVVAFLLTDRNLVYTTIILAVAAVLGVCVWLSWRWFRPSAASPMTEELRTADELWEQQLKDYEDFLKDRGSNLPFYMMIGESGGGKTFSLDKSEINWRIRKVPTGGTLGCNWWPAADAVILDTAGRYSVNTGSGELDEDARALWNQLIENCRERRPERPLNGVIVVLPCDKLLEDSFDERRAKARQLSAALSDLASTFKVHVPVYLLVTFCDKINGFREYFEGVPEPLKAQMIGYSVESDGHPFACSFADAEEGFRDVVRAFRRRRASLLLKNRSNASAVSAVLKFPERFSQIQRPLFEYVTQLFDERTPEDEPSLFGHMFRGFYFSSATQDGTTVTDKRFTEILGREPQHESRFDQARPLFLDDFFEKKVFKEPGLARPSARNFARIKRVKTIWNASLITATAGSLLYLGLWWAKTTKHLSQPNDRVAALHDELLEDVPRSGKQIKQIKDDRDADDIRDVLDRLEQLAPVNEVGDSVIESVQNFRTIGFITPERFVKGATLRDLHRSYRVAFVHGVLVPLRVDLERSLDNVRLEDIEAPERFQAFREAIVSYVELITSDTYDERRELATESDDADVPQPKPRERIAPLLRFAHDAAKSGGGYGVLGDLDKDDIDQIIAAFDLLVGFADDRAMGTVSDAWRGTGAHFGFLAIQDDRNQQSSARLLRDAFAKVNERWRRVFASPGRDTWFVTWDESEAAGQWWLLYGLETSLREQEQILGNLTRDPRLRRPASLAEWGRGADEWQKAFERFDASFVELGGIERLDGEWRDARDWLEKQWDSNFYGVLRWSLYETVNDSKGDYREELEDAERALREHWRQAVERVNDMYRTEPYGTDYSNVERNGVVTQSLTGSRLHRELSDTTLLVSESKQPWDGNRWDVLFASDGSLVADPRQPQSLLMPSAEGDATPARRLGEDLARLTAVRDREQADGEKPGDEHRAVRSNAIKAIATRVFRQIESTHPSEAGEAKSLDFTREEADAVFTEHLDALARGIEALDDLAGSFGRSRDDSIGMVDAYGESYLREWHRHWSVESGTELEQTQYGVGRRGQLEQFPWERDHILEHRGA
jgi:hypothetical protein